MRTLFKCFLFALLLCSFASCNKCGYEYILRDMKNPAASIPCYSATNCAKPFCYLSPKTKIYSAEYEGFGEGPLIKYRLVKVILYDRKDPVYVLNKHIFKYKPRGYYEKRTVYLLNSEFEYNHTFKYYPIYKDRKLKELSYKLYHRTYPVRTVRYGNVYEIELENGVKGYIPAKYLKKKTSTVHVFHQSYKHNKLAQLGIPILTSASEKYERLLTSDFCFVMSKHYNFLYAILLIILVVVLFSYALEINPFLDRFVVVLIFILSVAALFFQFIALDVVAKGVHPVHSVYFDFLEWAKILDWLSSSGWIGLLELLFFLLILLLIGYSVVIAFYTVCAAIGLFVIQGIIPVIPYALMVPGGKYVNVRKVLSIIGVGAIFLMVVLTAKFYPEDIDASSMRMIIYVCITISAIMSLSCMIIGLCEKKWLSVLYLTQPFIALLTGIVMYEYFGWMVTVLLYIVGGFVAFYIFVNSGRYDTLEDKYGDKIKGNFLDEDTFRDTDFNTYKRDRYDPQKFNLS